MLNKKKISLLLISTMLYTSYAFSKNDAIDEAYENEVSDIKFSYEQAENKLKSDYSEKYDEIKSKYSLAYDQISFFENESSDKVKNEINTKRNTIVTEVKQKKSAVQNEYKQRKERINQAYSKVKNDPDKRKYNEKKAKISNLYDIKKTSENKLYDVRKGMTDYFSDAKGLAYDDGRYIESFMKDTASLDKDIALAKLEKAHRQSMFHAGLRYIELKRHALKKYTEAKLAAIEDPATGELISKYINVPSYRGENFVKEVNVKSQDTIATLNHEFDSIISDYNITGNQLSDSSAENTISIRDLIDVVVDATAQ